VDLCFASVDHISLLYKGDEIISVIYFGYYAFLNL
jgi:hypothetical protein